MNYEDYLLKTLASLSEFIQSHIWELFLILVMICRKELRWIGLGLILLHIIWGSVPGLIWVIFTIKAIVIEYKQYKLMNTK